MPTGGALYWEASVIQELGNIFLVMGIKPKASNVGCQANISRNRKRGRKLEKQAGMEFEVEPFLLDTFYQRVEMELVCISCVLTLTLFPKYKTQCQT